MPREKKGLTNDHVVLFRTSDRSYAEFQRRYSHCLARFLRNAMDMALIDERFFSDVFFRKE